MVISNCFFTRPKQLFFLLVFLVFFQTSHLNAQDAVDYSKAAHWIGGVAFENAIGAPLKIGDSFLVIDAKGVLYSVDASDPYAPVVSPPVELISPIEGLFGPNEGYLYAAASEGLWVLEANTLAPVDLIFQADVSLMVFGDSYGAMLTDGGDKLVLFDQTLPLELPTIGSISITPYNYRMRDLVFHGDQIFLTKYYSERAVVVVDVSDPTAPEICCNFGWALEHKSQKTITHYHFSFRAFVSDDIYTLEQDYFSDSSHFYTAYEAYVTRWDYQDPLNPVVLSRGRLAGDHIRMTSNFSNVQRDELLSVIGTRIVATDLSAPDLDRSVVKVGLGPQHTVTGLARCEGFFVVSSYSGVLHFFADQQFDGPDPVSFSGGGKIDTAMAENRTVVYWTPVDDNNYYMVKVFDISDPFNPEMIEQCFGEHWEHRDCAVSSSCSVVFNPLLHVINLDSGVSAFSPMAVSGFIFVQPFIGVLVNEDGLFVLDITDPTNLLTLSNPSSQTATFLANVPGNPSLVAVSNEQGSLQFWNMEDPEDPVLVSSLDSDFDSIISQGGDSNSLLSCLRFDYEGWPGTTLQLVDLSDTSHPLLAGSLRLPGMPWDAWLQDSLLYLACGPAGLVIVDVSDPMDPIIHGGLGTDPVYAVRVQEENLLLMGEDLFVLPVDEASLVAVMVNGFSAVDRDGIVNLQWWLAVLGSPVEFRVLRLHQGAVTEITTQEEGQAWTALDRSPKWGETIYRLEQRSDSDPEWTFSSEVSISRNSPLMPRLLPPSPNPFNPQVTLVCEMPHDGPFRLRIFDLSGRVVRVLFDGSRGSGRFSFVWDGKDPNGRFLPSGTYVAELNSDGVLATRKLQLVR